MLFIKKKDSENITSKFDQCFLKNQIPKTGYQNQKLSWFSTDNNINKINVDYDKEIEYKFNDCGYRCESFIKREFTVLTIGCSVGFGNGIPEKYRFSAVFCQLLKNKINKEINDYNLSWPGVSGDYVSRMAAIAVPILKPNILLVNFPSLPRREYFDIDGNLFQYRPDRKPDCIKNAKFIDMFLNLSSPCQDAYNMWKNYVLIDSVCINNNVEFFYAIHNSDEGAYQRIKHLFNEGKRSSNLVKVDFARDGGHPGIKTNEQHAINFINVWNKNR